jgi:Tfp pilus assembly protein PilN
MVQVIPRKIAQQESIIKRVLPWFSLLLIVLVVGAYFIFDYQGKRAGTLLEETKEEITKNQTAEQTALQKNILSFQKRVNDVILLLKDKGKVSDSFKFLETYVHPKIYFNYLSIDFKGRTISLDGVSNDFTSLGQQISAFQQDPFLKSVELSSVGLSELGGVRFSLKLLLPDKTTDTNKQ